MPKPLGTLARVGRVLLGRQMAGRGLTVFPDDVFLVSYPRSGNTWARFLIGNMLNPDDPVTFGNVESRIPEIYFNPDRRLRRIPRPRLLKSHECFDPRYRRTIYVIRDPRDVAVSFYHHNVKAGNLPDGYPMEQFIPRFVAAEFDTRWGSWADNVKSWLCLRRDCPDFLLLFYDKMKENPARELAGIAAFLERCSLPKIDTRPEKLARVVELSSPERMRSLEKLQARQWALTEKTRQDKPFVRTATSGGWRKSLSTSSVAQIEGAWGDLMQELGYALSTASAVSQKGEFSCREPVARN